MNLAEALSSGARIHSPLKEGPFLALPPPPVMPHSRSPEGTAAQKRRDLRRRRYMRSALPILRTQRDTAEQTLARHITIADAQAAATLERHEEARRVIAYIEAQHQAAASQITAL